MALEAIRNPRRYLGTQIRQKWGSIKLLAFDPESFFEEHVGQYGLRKESLFVALVMIVAFAGWGYAIQTMLDHFVVGTGPIGDAEARMSSETERRVWGYGVNWALTVLALWLGYTGSIQLLSWLYNARGSPSVLLKNVAWGLFPLLIGHIVYGIGLVITFTTIDLETDLRDTAGESTRYLVNQGLTEPIMIVATIVFLGCIAWSGYLLVLGTEQARNLDRASATKVVAVPVALYALYIAWDMLTRLGVL